MKAYIVSLEGIDNSGKTFHKQTIAKIFEENGFVVKQMRECTEDTTDKMIIKAMFERISESYKKELFELWKYLGLRISDLPNMEVEVPTIYLYDRYMLSTVAYQTPKLSGLFTDGFWNNCWRQSNIIDLQTSMFPLHLPSFNIIFDVSQETANKNKKQANKIDANDDDLWLQKVVAEIYKDESLIDYWKTKGVNCEILNNNGENIKTSQVVECAEKIANILKEKSC